MYAICCMLFYKVRYQSSKTLFCLLRARSGTARSFQLTIPSGRASALALTPSWVVVLDGSERRVFLFDRARSPGALLCSSPPQVSSQPAADPSPGATARRGEDCGAQQHHRGARVFASESSGTVVSLSSSGRAETHEVARGEEGSATRLSLVPSAAPDVPADVEKEGIFALWTEEKVGENFVCLYYFLRFLLL